jgi:hypothetical protein
MNHFFYRIDHCHLIPGNKTSGFILYLSRAALRTLMAIQVTTESVQTLNEEIRNRLDRAGLKKFVNMKQCGVLFYSEGSGIFSLSACPVAFITDPMFGGSIGESPDELKRVLCDPSDEDDYPVSFTPHNIDHPRQALALMLMIQTWGEWAYTQLSMQADEQATKKG